MADNKSSVTLPLLITKGLILFPGNARLIDAGRDFSINAIKVAKSKTDSLILITSQRDENLENPTAEDIYLTGVLARVISISEREKRIRARVEVVSRVTLSNIELDEKDDKCFIADGNLIEPIAISDKESEAIVSSINHEIEKYPSLFVCLLSGLPTENLLDAIQNDEEQQRGDHHQGR